MQIQNPTHISAISSTNQTNNQDIKPVNQVTHTNDTLKISDLGKVTQEIDSLFDKVDNIYMTHLSAEQKQELETSYQQLDTLFESKQPNEAQDKKINALFEKIDSIFTSAEKSLSPNEQDTLSKLESKIDNLLEIENEGFGSQINEDLDSAFKQRDELLTSKLSSQQKNDLKSLNESLNALFDNLTNDENNDKANKLFEKIDNILQSSYNKLSESDKNKVDELDSNINNLFQDLEQTIEENITY
ncbi:hypothetical protein KO527_04135 [Pseudoalteromonas sp. C2R02]|uniref:hypothetical protein n=1 Tax=Pseudoalteromonas sp. C2R02 TaxID=2841565 RepID=UPI001C0A1BEF|nr:hypothetical protein [Pseudoalteromonas sp. C2R02]MBU2968548.1 hypothetical protein [Pseudoalteromonas sp. C2R02]